MDMIYRVVVELLHKIIIIPEIALIMIPSLWVVILDWITVCVVVLFANIDKNVEWLEIIRISSSGVLLQ